METARKSLELQAQVRHNAEELKNTFSDLYSWQKDIKDKEKNLKKPNPKQSNQGETLPVRGINKKKMVENMTSDSLVTDNNNNMPPEKETNKREEDPHIVANKIKDRGNKLVKSADYAEAIVEYSQAIEVYAQDSIYYANRAFCYLKLEKYRLCLADCDVALSLDENSVKALYRRMLANEGCGNNLDALRDCNRLLELEPKNVSAQRSLIRINENLRKTMTIEKGTQFSPLLPNMEDIDMLADKPVHERSTKPLVKIPIEEVIGPHVPDSALKISDEDIDKIFNSNCGPYVEVKKTVPQEDKPKVDLPSAPATTAQFYSNWKELSLQQRMDFVKSVEPTNFSKILGAGLDSYTLSEILQTLKHFEVPVMATYMVELMKNPAISILSMFISQNDNEALGEIVKKLKSSDKHEEAVSSIVKCFNL